MEGSDAAGLGRKPPVTKDGGAPDLDHGLVFGQTAGFLLAQLGFETARRFGRLMQDAGLDPRQFAVLRAIEVLNGRAQNVVGEQLRIPASSMVGVVDHLEAGGLVERRPHPTDRRSRTLHLTETGRDAIAQATGLAAGFEAALVAPLTGAQYRELVELLTRLADGLGLDRGVHPGMSEHAEGPPWRDG